MKKFKYLLLLLLVLPCFLLIGGCSFNDKVYVVDIVETETVGTATTYTVYYSDGSTSILTVNNGKDGEDGISPSIEDLFNKYKEENPDATYEDFLEDFLTLTLEHNAVQYATNMAIQSAVTIWSEFPTGSYNSKSTMVGCGSGVVYKMEEDYSYIITNYHVVYYEDSNTTTNIANKIHVFQYGTSELAYKTKDYDENGYPVIAYGDGAIKAEYIGGEMSFDIAVLKVPTSELLKYNEHVKPVSVAKDYDLGETAIAIGNPEQEGFSVTSGIISVISEEITMKGADEQTDCTFRVMRIDTAVNGGNSGGGLFDINGDWIGIVNAKAVASEIDNIAYAIPFDNVVAVADNIIHYYNQAPNTPGKVKKLVLNVTFTTENSRALYNPTTNKTIIKEDITIKDVTADKVGHLMGIKSGDKIRSISINGVNHTIYRGYQLTDLLLTIREGDKIIIFVEREGYNELQKCGITDSNGILASYLKTID